MANQVGQVPGNATTKDIIFFRRVKAGASSHFTCSRSKFTLLYSHIWQKMPNHAPKKNMQMDKCLVWQPFLDMGIFVNGTQSALEPRYKQRCHV